MRRFSIFQVRLAAQDQTGSQFRGSLIVLSGVIASRSAKQLRGQGSLSPRQPLPLKLLFVRHRKIHPVEGHKETLHIQLGKISLDQS